MSDLIKNPKHYSPEGAIECIDYIVSHKMCFRQGNVVKYVTRFRHKGTPLDDLKKARQYLDWLIAEEEWNSCKEDHAHHLKIHANFGTKPKNRKKAK